MTERGRQSKKHKNWQKSDIWFKLHSNLCRFSKLKLVLPSDQRYEYSPKKRTPVFLVRRACNLQQLFVSFCPPSLAREILRSILFCTELDSNPTSFDRTDVRRNLMSLQIKKTKFSLVHKFPTLCCFMSQWFFFNPARVHKTPIHLLINAFLRAIGNTLFIGWHL